VVHGSPHPPSGVINEPLGRDPDDRRRVIVVPGGAPSETRYEVTRSCPGDLSLVRCELVTGRTHQIRVHLSTRGWPIAGDRLYGGGTDLITRQALHAWRVSLPHPLTRQPLVVEAPPPQDFNRINC
jgi:23S rRNA-/tRNA-specific pseudouridylate synthase